MNSFLKVLLVLLVIAYIVSPVDFMPGPIDDIIVIMLGVAAEKK